MYAFTYKFFRKTKVYINPKIKKIMEIKGVLIVNPLMSQMEVGQTGFLDVEAITLSDNEIFIDTSYSISEIEEKEKYRIQIKRIGPGKEDFEIDFNTSYDFCNCKLSKEDKEDFAKDSNVIGPFQVITEIYKPNDYHEQLFPRLSLDRLLEALVIINTSLRENPDSERDLRDKEKLRELIKKKLSKCTLDEIKSWKKTFAEFTEEESENGKVFNALADEEILNFINKKINDLKTQQKLDDLSLQELEAEKKRLLENQQYEKAAVYRDAINRKSNGEKQ